MKPFLVVWLIGTTLAIQAYGGEAPRPPDVVVYLADDLSAAELKAWMKEQGDELTVFHEPLMLDAPDTWRPRR